MHTFTEKVTNPNVTNDSKWEPNHKNWNLCTHSKMKKKTHTTHTTSKLTENISNPNASRDSKWEPIHWNWRFIHTHMIVQNLSERIIDLFLIMIHNWYKREHEVDAKVSSDGRVWNSNLLKERDVQIEYVIEKLETANLCCD